MQGIDLSKLYHALQMGWINNFSSIAYYIWFGIFAHKIRSACAYVTSIHKKDLEVWSQIT